MPIDRAAIGSWRGRLNSLPTRIALASSLLWAAVFVYAPTLPGYAKHAGASLGEIGLITAAFGLSQFVLRLPVGMTSDLLGRRLPYLAGGLVLVGLGGLVLIVAPDSAWLGIGRGLAGAGAASWVATTVLFTRVFPPGQSARALSLINGYTGLAQILATFSGGLLAQYAGPTTPFLASAILAVLGLIALWQIHEPRPTPAASTPAGTAPARPSLRVPLTGPLIVACLLGAVTTASMHGNAYSFAPVLVEKLGGAPADAGTMTALLLATYTVGSFTGGALSARIGVLPTLLFATVCTGLPLVPLAWVANLTTMGVLEGVHGYGRGILVPLMMVLALSTAPPRARATTMGIFQTCYAVGLFAGPAGLGFVAQQAGLEATFVAAGAASLACLPFLPLVRFRFRPVADASHDPAAAVADPQPARSEMNAN